MSRKFAEASCKRKVFYKSRAGANYAVGKLTLKKGKAHRSYKCLVCPGFHITTQVRRRG